MKLVIEPATVKDAEAVTKVLSVTWLDTYPNEAAGISYEDIRRRVEGEHGELIDKKVAKWRRRLAVRDNLQTAFVARTEDGRVVGFYWSASC